MAEVIWWHAEARLSAVLRYERDGIHMEFSGAGHPLAVSARRAGEFEVAFGDIKETCRAAWSGRDLDLLRRRGRQRRGTGCLSRQGDKSEDKYEYTQ